MAPHFRLHVWSDVLAYVVSILAIGLLAHLALSAGVVILMCVCALALTFSGWNLILFCARVARDGE